MKFIALSLIVLMVLAFTGCGSRDDQVVMHRYLPRAADYKITVYNSPPHEEGYVTLALLASDKGPLTWPYTKDDAFVIDLVERAREIGADAVVMMPKKVAIIGMKSVFLKSVRMPLRFVTRSTR